MSNPANKYDILKTEIRQLIQKKRYEEILNLIDRQKEIFIGNNISDKDLDAEYYFRKIFENSLTGFGLARINGEIINCNPYLIKMLGFNSIEELKRRNIKEFYKDFSEREKLLELLNKDGFVKEFKLNVKTNDNKTIVALVNANILQNGLKEPIVIVNFEDISVQEKFKQDLIENEKYLDLILNSVNSGVLLIDPKTHKIIDVNRSALKMLKHNKESVVGKECFGFVCPAEKGKCPITDLKETVDDSVRELVTSEGEKRYILKSVKQIEIKGKAFLLETFADMQEQKRVEAELKELNEDLERRIYERTKELKESENKYKSLFQSSRDAIVLVTQKGFFDCNQAALDIYGYNNKEEFLKLHPADLSPEYQPNGSDSLKQSNQYIKEALNKKTPMFEWVHKKKSGELFDCEVLLSPMEIGGMKAAHALIRDVSERKKTEEVIKKNEEKFRKLSELSPSGISIQRKNKYYYVNQAWSNITGYEISEIDKIGPFDIIHPEMRKYVKEMSDKELKKNGARLRYEMKVLTKQNEIKWVDVSLTTIIYENEFATLAVSNDITAQKKTEEIIKKQLEEIQIQNEEIKTINEELHAVNEDLENKFQEINALNKNLKISENKFKDLVKNIPGVVYNCLNDASWTMKYISDDVEKLTGYPASDFINNKVRSYADIIHPNDVALVEKRVSEGIHNQHSFKIEYRIIDAKGKIKWVYERGQKTQESNNKDILNGVILDITEKKKIDQALKKSKELYQKLVNNQGEGIVIVDNDNVFVFANPATHELLGVEEGSLVGKNVKDFLSKEYVNIVNSQTENRKTGKKNTYELEILRPDNRKRHILVTASPEYNEENVVTGAFAIFRDITERKEVEIALVDSEIELRKSNAQKDRFFSLLAHDLRSPVGNFLQITELLKMQYENLERDQIHYFFDNLHALADKTFKLLDNLLMWSRSQLGKLEINAEEINIYNIVQEIAELYSENINFKRIKFKNYIPKDLIVNADINVIQTLFRNLISNAIKFTNSDGRIVISSELEVDKNNKEHYLISIQDTGVGIPEDKIETIFNVDEDYTTVGTNNEKGTGLGLMLCKELIEKSGEKIWLGSQEGKGTTFFFTLKR
jgi:PAS domain S-box-containing protein